MTISTSAAEHAAAITRLTALGHQADAAAAAQTILDMANTPATAVRVTAAQKSAAVTALAGAVTASHVIQLKGHDGTVLSG